MSDFREAWEGAINVLRERNDEIASLRAQLTGCGGDVKACTSDVPCAFGALAQIENLRAQLANAIQKHIDCDAILGARLASAQKALEEIAKAGEPKPEGFREPDDADWRFYALEFQRLAALALTDEQRDHDPNMNPVDDAEFGMKP